MCWNFLKKLENIRSEWNTKRHSIKKESRDNTSWIQCNNIWFNKINQIIQSKLTPSKNEISGRCKEWFFEGESEYIEAEGK
jgi:hypothetical protein